MSNEFSACIVLPFYNHESLIAKMIESLKSAKLPCLLINDGSRAEAGEILKSLEIDNEWLTVINRQENGGKGAAVCTGFNEAKKAGYTHVLQIDSDCQHDVSDIPKFIDKARENQDALILGEAVYDQSVPKSRLYGRYVTHWWVMIETLSSKILDTMCGFRVYPLSSVFPVIQHGIGKRMDFDTEIVVKMIWRGNKILPLKTHVNYPDDGVSHFHYFKGNICISWMHTKLFFGMLWRLPYLLKRKCCP
jgi:glycosyltransferase involved in cell wall biosynthesis